MDKINEIKNANKNLCEDILKRIKNIDAKDYVDIESIISKDNTEPIYVQTYLTIIKKLKIKDFENEIEKYKFFLSEEIIKNSFPEFKGEKKSSEKLFKELISKIMKFNKFFETKTLYQKIYFYNNLVFFDLNCEKIKGCIVYKNNKELAIYCLVDKIKEGIIKYINKIKNDNDNIKNEDETIKFIKQSIKEGEIFKKVENFMKETTINNTINISTPTEEEKALYYSILNSNKNYNADEAIKKAKEHLNFILKIDSKDFLTYFDNYSTFLSDIKENFENRFEDFNNLNENDFELLMDFCFFLEFYDFKSDTLYFYINKWKNSFKQTNDYINNILKEEKNNYIYDSKNNKLSFILVKPLKTTKYIKIINDINNYCIDCVIYYFNKNYPNSNKKEDQNKIDNDFIIDEEVINEYSIENLLKFDSFKNIYIYKKWDIIKTHLIKIFTSNTFISLFKKLCNDLHIDNPYNFIDKKNLESILEKSRIFQFKTDDVGITNPHFFMDYVYYGGKMDSYSINDSKLLNITYYQVTQEHEVFGHLNIKVQNYLSEKEISSPIINVKDSKGNIKNYPESGETIEKLLYNRVISTLTYNEIFFILDAENYQLDYESFKNNFIKCNDSDYKISDSLSQLLTSLDIKISEIYNPQESIDLNRNLGKKISNKDLFRFKRKRHIHFDMEKEIELNQKLMRELQNYPTLNKK